MFVLFSSHCQNKNYIFSGFDTTRFVSRECSKTIYVFLMLIFVPFIAIAADEHYEEALRYFHKGNYRQSEYQLTLTKRIQVYEKLYGHLALARGDIRAAADSFLLYAEQQKDPFTAYLSAMLYMNLEMEMEYRKALGLVVTAAKPGYEKEKYFVPFYCKGSPVFTSASPSVSSEFFNDKLSFIEWYYAVFLLLAIDNENKQLKKIIELESLPVFPDRQTSALLKNPFSSDAHRDCIRVAVQPGSGVEKHVKDTLYKNYVLFTGTSKSKYVRARFLYLENRLIPAQSLACSIVHPLLKEFPDKSFMQKELLEYSGLLGEIHQKKNGREKNYFIVTLHQTLRQYLALPKEKQKYDQMKFALMQKATEDETDAEALHYLIGYFAGNKERRREYETKLENLTKKKELDRY